MHCKDHPEICFRWTDPGDLLLIPECNTELNVVILIGLLHRRLHMKRDEIQVFLWGKSIYLSTGTISNRSLDFLLLFEQFHKENSSKLKVLFDRQKCVILHVDGTFRSGGKVVYVLQNDSFEIIVDASLIPSEAEEYVTPILQDFKKIYGQPDVVVRDMAKGPALSISTVFPKSLQQVCQVHFIRSLEKNLIMDLHKTLKELIVKHKFTSALKELREVNEDKSDDVIKNLQRRWAHIAADYLLHPLKKRVKWISCPISYYVQYCRVKEVAVFVRRIIRCNASHNLICSEVMELDKCLKSILEDPEITRSSYRLQRTMNWLDDLRNHLRVTRENHLKDVPPEEASLEDCKKNIKNKLAEISQEGKELGGKYEKIAVKINNGFEQHWDELFVPDPIVDGKKISFRRHNNGLESSHRRIRKAIRERTGRGETNREMEQFGDLIAILSNLWNKTYQKEILSDVNDLAVSLSPFVNDLPELRKKYHELRKGAEIPIPDYKRMDVLQEFVETLESSKMHDELRSILENILSVENI